MQNRITDQAAFIIHRRDYQDSSLILEIFSEDYGRLSLLAKGARKRRDAAHFQVCNRLLLGWSGRAELKTLTQIESQAIPVPPAIYPALYYVNELLLYLLPSHDEHRSLFKRYQVLLLEFSQLDQQAQSGMLEPLLREFEIEFLTELGVMPDLSYDHSTGEAVQSEPEYGFNVMSGVQSTQIDSGNSYTGSDLLCIHNRQFESAQTLTQAKRLMRQIIDYNLQGRTLQSRKFYQLLKKK